MVLADRGVSSVVECGEKRLRRDGDSLRIEGDSATRAALVASSGALPERAWATGRRGSGGGLPSADSGITRRASRFGDIGCGARDEKDSSMAASRGSKSLS